MSNENYNRAAKTAVYPCPGVIIMMRISAPLCIRHCFSYHCKIILCSLYIRRTDITRTLQPSECSSYSEVIVMVILFLFLADNILAMRIV